MTEGSVHHLHGRPARRTSRYLAGWNEDEGPRGRRAREEQGDGRVLHRAGEESATRTRLTRTSRSTRPRATKEARRVRRGLRRRHVHRLRHVEVDRRARADGAVAGVHAISGSVTGRSPADQKVNGVAATSKDIGARHAGEIEYVFGALKSDVKAPWEDADVAISDQMMTFWSNFAKTGNPSGEGVPAWPADRAVTGYQVMHIGEKSHAAPDALRDRYLFLDAGSREVRAAATQ